MESRLQAESLRNLPSEGTLQPVTRTRPNPVLAGSLAGLSLISKPEIAFAALAAGFLALIVESLTQNVNLMARGGVVLGAGGYYRRRDILRYSQLCAASRSARRQPCPFHRDAATIGLFQSPRKRAGAVAFVAVVQPGRDRRTLALWVGLCGVIGAIASRKQAEWRGALKAGLILACAGALWREAAISFFGASSNVTPFA